MSSWIHMMYLFFFSYCACWIARCSVYAKRTESHSHRHVVAFIITIQMNIAYCVPKPWYITHQTWNIYYTISSEQKKGEKNVLFLCTIIIIWAVIEHVISNHNRIEITEFKICSKRGISELNIWSHSIRF